MRRVTKILALLSALAFFGADTALARGGWGGGGFGSGGFSGGRFGGFGGGYWGGHPGGWGGGWHGWHGGGWGWGYPYYDDDFDWNDWPYDYGYPGYGYTPAPFVSPYCATGTRVCILRSLRHIGSSCSCKGARGQISGAVR